MAGVSLFDWRIYQHMFATARMEDIFGEHPTIAAWVDTERAVARAQATVGIIPGDAASAIDGALDADAVDLERLYTDTVDVGRPIAGLIKQLAEQVGDPHGVWVHYGITTYDVMDTGRVLQIRDGLDAVAEALHELTTQLRDLAAAHRDTPMIARTNNLHALPTTFGAKIANWVEEMDRHADRLTEVRTRALVVQFGGAVGSLASLHPHGLAFRNAAAAELGLGAPKGNWHNARDAISEVSLQLGNLCASLARIARNINALSGTDIGEVSEAGPQGRGRSTSMPHKRNPRAAEFAEATARLGRHRAMGMVEVMGQDHDRCGGTWIAEWMLVPETFLLTSSALHWASDLFARLEVHADRMAANIGAMNGLIMAERFTLALARKITKFEAREIVDDACARAVAEDRMLADVLADTDRVTGHLSPTEIADLASPDTYLGAAPDIVDRIVKDGD